MHHCLSLKFLENWKGAGMHSSHFFSTSISERTPSMFRLGQKTKPVRCKRGKGKTFRRIGFSPLGGRQTKYLLPPSIDWKNNKQQFGIWSEGKQFSARSGPGQDTGRWTGPLSYRLKYWWFMWFASCIVVIGTIILFISCEYRNSILKRLQSSEYSPQRTFVLFLNPEHTTIGLLIFLSWAFFHYLAKLPWEWNKWT